MDKIFITADSGADIPSERAKDLGIHIVPFHLSIGEHHCDDGEIEPVDMLELCQAQKDLAEDERLQTPMTTRGCSGESLRKIRMRTSSI